MRFFCRNCLPLIRLRPPSSMSTGHVVPLRGAGFKLSYSPSSVVDTLSPGSELNSEQTYLYGLTECRVSDKSDVCPALCYHGMLKYLSHYAVCNNGNDSMFYPNFVLQWKQWTHGPSVILMVFDSTGDGETCHARHECILSSAWLRIRW